MEIDCEQKEGGYLQRRRRQTTAEYCDKISNLRGLRFIFVQKWKEYLSLCTSKHLKGRSGPRVGNVFGPNIPEVIRDPSSVRFCDFFSSHFCFEFFSSLNLKKGTPRE